RLVVPGRPQQLTELGPGHEADHRRDDGDRADRRLDDRRAAALACREEPAEEPTSAEQEVRDDVAVDLDHAPDEHAGEQPAGDQEITEHDGREGEPHAATLSRSPAPLDRSTLRSGMQSSAATKLARPRRIAGRYDVIRELGRGGMGAVYEVADPA